MNSMKPAGSSNRSDVSADCYNVYSLSMYACIKQLLAIGFICLVSLCQTVRVSERVRLLLQ